MLMEIQGSYLFSTFWDRIFFSFLFFSWCWFCEIRTGSGLCFWFILLLLFYVIKMCWWGRCKKEVVLYSRLASTLSGIQIKKQNKMLAAKNAALRAACSIIISQYFHVLVHVFLNDGVLIIIFFSAISSVLFFFYCCQ